MIHGFHLKMEAAVDWTLPDGFTARERSFCCREDLVITRHSGIFLAVTACLGPIHSLSPASAGIASGMPSTSVLSSLSSHCYFLHPSAFLSRRGSFNTQLFASNLFQKWSDETSIWCGLSLLKYFGDFVAGRCLPLWNKPLVRPLCPSSIIFPLPPYIISLCTLWASQAVPALCPAQARFPSSQCYLLLSWGLLRIFRRSSSAPPTSSSSSSFLAVAIALFITSACIAVVSVHVCPVHEALSWKKASCVQYITDVEYW